ncbi:MAG: enoyl-CoA hydratase [Alphaproteobacteria bacterium]|nr:enoyl-CoA hydratase [Alphaproteobacteria bacterium]
MAEAQIEQQETEIQLIIDAPIATVTINRAEDENRLTRANLERLGEIANILQASDDVQAVLITGTGDDFFSAGLLNPVIRAAMSKDEVLETVILANTVFDAIEALPQIVIAVLNGSIRAGASELALVCDIRLVADHATLALPEAKWGGFPGAGAPHRLPMVIGQGRALELICTGREIDAATMERVGFVEYAIPANDLWDFALTMAQQIGANGPLAIRGAKRIMRVRQEPGFKAARELSDALRHALEWSHDVDEGMAAHRENRTPNFTGR